MKKLVMVLTMMIALGGLLIAPASVTPVPTASCQTVECKNAKVMCTNTYDFVYEGCMASGGSSVGCYLTAYREYEKCMWEWGCNPYAT
jgi:hypothetical protein